MVPVPYLGATTTTAEQEQLNDDAEPIKAIGSINYCCISLAVFDLLTTSPPAAATNTAFVDKRAKNKNECAARDNTAANDTAAADSFF